MSLKILIVKYFILELACIQLIHAVTMEQFLQSLDMMRNGCAPKFPKISKETYDGIRNGDFGDESMDIRCYAKCIAQLAGTITKKGEFSTSKALAQVPIILPVELQAKARDAMESCKDAQKPYKDACDRTFYTTKCVRDYSPADFKFP